MNWTLGQADAEDAPFEISLEGSQQLVPAGTGVPGEYGLHLASSTGGAFSPLSANLTSTVLPPVVANDGSGTAYAAQIGGGQSSYGVNFDDVNELASLLGTEIAGGTAEVGSGGNPDNCARYTFGAHGFSSSNNYVDLDVTGLTIAAVDWQAYTTLATARATRGSYGANFSGDTTLVQNNWVNGNWTPGAPLSGETTLRINIRAGAPTAQAAGEERIDNIVVTTTALSEGLYRFTTYASSPSRSNVTPSGRLVPRLPFTLAASGANLSLIASDDDGFVRYLESSNAGGTWVDRGSTGRTGVLRGADIRVAFGESRLEMSSNGRDWYSRYGDFGQKVGYGLIKGVRVIL